MRVALAAAAALGGALAAAPPAADADAVRAAHARLGSFPDYSACEPADTAYEYTMPRDLGTHPTSPYEFFWFFGNLFTDAGRHFGVLLGVSRFAFDCEDVDHNLYNRLLTVADTDADAFHYDLADSLGWWTNASTDASPFVLQSGGIFDYEQTDATTIAMSGATADGALAVSLSARIASDPPLALMGQNGFDVDAAGNAKGYHVALTDLETQGSVTVDGQTYEVSGKMYEQHKWQLFGDRNASVPGGYDWLTAQLDNGWNVVATAKAPYGVYNDTSPDTHVNIANMPGASAALFLDAEQFELTRAEPWVSSVSGETWMTEHTLLVDALGLNITWHQYIQDNEVVSGGSNVVVEGASYITGTVGGKEVKGTGWTGLNHSLL